MSQHNTLLMVAQLDVYDTLHPPIIGYSVLRIHLAHVERNRTSGSGVYGLSLNIIMGFPTKHKVTCKHSISIQSSMSVFSKMGASGGKYEQ